MKKALVLFGMGFVIFCVLPILAKLVIFALLAAFVCWERKRK